jgi:Protein of unknown function (DUF2726)
MAMERFAPYLLALLLLMVLLLGVMALLKRRRQSQRMSHARSKQAKTEDLDTVAAWEPKPVRILSAPEREAYHTLRRALPEHMVLAQVPLARFLKVPTRNSYAEWMRRVGSLCADLVICDANAQVVAVVEVRQPLGRAKDRAVKRQTRMDRVLAAADIPVHVWLEGALPGPAVARETILGSAVVFTTKSGATLVDTSAQAKAPPLPAGLPGLEGLAVHETPVDFDLDDGLDDGPASRRMSTWFESAHSGAVPLDEPGLEPMRGAMRGPVHEAVR